MPSSNISFHKLDISRKKEVEFLLKKYAEDEVLCNFIQLTKEDKSIFIDTYLKLAFNGISIALIDDETKKMVGIEINSVPEHYKAFGGFDKVAKKLSSESEKMFRFDLHMEEGTVNFFGSENYMIAEMCYILPEYRRSGLIERIWKRLANIAGEQNLEGVMGVFNSHVLADKSFRSLQFLPLKRVYYKDYRDPVTGEAIFAGLPSSTHLYASQAIQFSKRPKL